MEFKKFTSISQDDVTNIYENIEPNEDVTTDFASGKDILEPSHKLRDQLDDISSMWDRENLFLIFHKLKEDLEKACLQVNEERFLASELIESGSWAEQSFFTTMSASSEGEIRKKVFSKQGTGNVDQENLLKNFISNNKTLLITLNDIDFMMVPGNLEIPCEDYLQRTENPGFYRLCFSGTENSFSTWSDCFIQNQCQYYLSQNLIKQKFRTIFARLEKEGPYIVKEGGLAFQVAIFRENSVHFCDIVFALSLPFWPSDAAAWRTRSRVWPELGEVSRISQNGTHIVPKRNEKGNIDLDWRISFSHAETSLSYLPLTYWYVITPWRILKNLLQSLNLETRPKLISSYMLKTLLFYSMERVPVDHWFSTDNLIKSVLGVIDDLIKYLAQQKCPHFFIPEINLFHEISSDFYPTLTLNIIKLRDDFVIDPVKIVFGEK